jgi:hypothetical protein
MKNINIQAKVRVVMGVEIPTGPAIRPLLYFCCLDSQKSLRMGKRGVQSTEFDLGKNL